MAATHKPHPPVHWLTPCPPSCNDVYTSWTVYLDMISPQKGALRGLAKLESYVSVIAILKRQGRPRDVYTTCVLPHNLQSYVNSLTSHHQKVKVKVFTNHEDNTTVEVPIHCKDIFRFKSQNCPKCPARRPARRLNIPDRSTPDASDAKFRSLVEEYPGKRTNSENFQVGNTRGASLTYADDSVSHSAGGLGRPVGAPKVEKSTVEDCLVDGLKFEDGSESDDDADSRSPIDESNAKEPKVEDSRVDSLKTEDDAVSDISDVEYKTYIKDHLRDDDSSASDASEESLATSLGALELKERCVPEPPRASFLRLPTEMLQAIFMQLPTQDAVKALAGTCRGMRAASKGYEKKLLWTILSRELGPTLPGTLGALVIFVSPQKGPFEEPIIRNLCISLRYWAPMLRKYEEEAQKMVTLTMANQMLVVYRQFPTLIADRPRVHGPSRVCSACQSLDSPDDEWNPLDDRTNQYCMEHVLQANAVRFRLNCRMAPGYPTPNEPVNDVHDTGWNWDSQPIVADIMREVEVKQDDESGLEDSISLDDTIGWEHEFELENDSGYEGESEVEDVTEFDDGTGLEHDLELVINPQYEEDPENEGVFEELDNNHQGRKANQEKEIQLDDKFYPEKDDGKKYRLRRQEENPRVDQTQKENQLRPKYKASPGDKWHREVKVYEDDEINPEDGIRQEFKLLDEDEKQTKLWRGCDEAISLPNTILPF